MRLDALSCGDQASDLIKECSVLGNLMPKRVEFIEKLFAHVILRNSVRS